MEARRPNHPLSLGINGNQSTTGRQGLAKEFLEAPCFMAIPVWMLFPNEPIGSDGVEVIVVFGAQPPELDEVALQNRVIVKGHSGLPVPAVDDYGLVDFLATASRRKCIRSWPQ